MIKTALIAGGGGFIGSHLSEYLLTKDFLVIVVDNFITGDKKNIIHLLDNPRFTFIEADVVTQIPLICKKVTQKIDYIFHLASPASPNKKSEKSFIHFPIETLLVNSYGTYQLLEFAKDRMAKFLFTSSSETYGDPSISPQGENYFGNVNPVGPRSVYDEGKRFGESITMAYVRKFNLDARIIRVFNTYGPRMQKDDGRVVSNFITQALSKKPITVYGKGDQTRSFCYVSDMVEGLFSAMNAQNTKGEVINIGNPDERTVLELAKMIKEMTQSPSEIVFEELPQDDPKKRRPDITKAKNLIQWYAMVSLSSGLKKTIEYLQAI